MHMIAVPVASEKRLKGNQSLTDATVLGRQSYIFMRALRALAVASSNREFPAFSKLFYSDCQVISGTILC